MELRELAGKKTAEKDLKVMGQRRKACSGGSPEIWIFVLSPGTGVPKKFFVRDLLATEAIGNETKAVPDAEPNGAISTHEGTRGEASTRTVAGFADTESEATRLKNWSQQSCSFTKKSGRTQLIAAHDG